MQGWHLNSSRKAQKLQSTSEIAEQVTCYFREQFNQAILFFQATALATAV